MPYDPDKLTVTALIPNGANPSQYVHTIEGKTYPSAERKPDETMEDTCRRLGRDATATFVRVTRRAHEFEELGPHHIAYLTEPVDATPLDPEKYYWKNPSEA